MEWLHIHICVGLGPDPVLTVCPFSSVSTIAVCCKLCLKAWWHSTYMLHESWQAALKIPLIQLLQQTAQHVIDLRVVFKHGHMLLYCLAPATIDMSCTQALHRNCRNSDASLLMSAITDRLTSLALSFSVTIFWHILVPYRTSERSDVHRFPAESLVKRARISTLYCSSNTLPYLHHVLEQRDIHFKAKHPIDCEAQVVTVQCFSWLLICHNCCHGQRRQDAGRAFIVIMVGYKLNSSQQPDVVMSVFRAVQSQGDGAIETGTFVCYLLLSKNVFTLFSQQFLLLINRATVPAITICSYNAEFLWLLNRTMAGKMPI